MNLAFDFKSLAILSNDIWILQNIMNSAIRYCTNKNIARLNCSMISLHLLFCGYLSHLLKMSCRISTIERNRRWRTCFYCKITAINQFDKKKWATFEVYILFLKNWSMPFLFFKKTHWKYPIIWKEIYFCRK